MQKKSFTLIETLVTITCLGVLMVLIYGLIFSLYKAQSFGWEESVAIEEARRGVKAMVREIREATQADDGSYLIKKADNGEFIFYSDIDKDGAVERVRYFVGSLNSGNSAKECYSTQTGGSCNVTFSNFLQGQIKSANLQVAVEGDFGQTTEYADFIADSQNLGRICVNGCSDCAGSWQGSANYNVKDLAQDGILQVVADSSSAVNNSCNWLQTNHSMKAQFILSWQEEISGLGNQLKKGVTKPSSYPLEYDTDNEQISIMSSYVRNGPAIFTYYDKDGNEIIIAPARLIDTKMVKVRLVVNVNPNNAPKDFELESFVQLRNLKDEI